MEEYKIYLGAQFEWTSTLTGKNYVAEVTNLEGETVRLTFLEEGHYHEYTVDYLLSDLKAVKAKQIK